MILKIKGYQEEDWWIFGEIRRIHPGVVNKAKSLEDDYDLVLLADNTKQIKCLRIVLRFMDGLEFSILTDSVAYLCNDCGETIEKILV